MNYRLARFPVQVVEQVWIGRLGEDDRLRRAYEGVLVACDSVVGGLLADDAVRAAARARACALRRRAVRERLRYDKVDAEIEVLMQGHRDRFLRRQREYAQGSERYPTAGPATTPAPSPPATRRQRVVGPQERAQRT